MIGEDRVGRSGKRLTRRSPGLSEPGLSVTVYSQRPSTAHESPSATGSLRSTPVGSRAVQYRDRTAPLSTAQHPQTANSRYPTEQIVAQKPSVVGNTRHDQVSLHLITALTTPTHPLFDTTSIRPSPWVPGRHRADWSPSPLTEASTTATLPLLGGGAGKTAVRGHTAVGPPTLP